jgi:hypothetical protein
MRKSSFIYLAYLPLISFSCKEYAGKKDQMQRRFGVDTLQTVGKIADDKKGIDTLGYISMGNPDTALVIFLFKNCFSYDYDFQKEEYIRWDLEKHKQLPLFISMFENKSDFDIHLKQVEKNQRRFLLDARSKILSDYKKYYSIIDDMEFEYLLKRRDSELRLILIKMLNNRKVATSEKKQIGNILKGW